MNPDGFIANTNAKKITQIKASIDAMDILNSSNITLEMSSEKLLFLDKIRRAWSQKSFRDAGKTKTQYHLPLTKVAKARLDKMSALCNKSQAATLNDLINEAYLKKYIDEEGKDKY